METEAKKPLPRYVELGRAFAATTKGWWLWEAPGVAVLRTEEITFVLGEDDGNVNVSVYGDGFGVGDTYTLDSSMDSIALLRQSILAAEAKLKRARIRAARPTVDQIAQAAGFDSHDAWTRWVTAEATKAAMQRITALPTASHDGGFYVRANVFYNMGPNDDDPHTPAADARGVLADGSDDTRATVTVRIQGIAVDRFSTAIGERRCTPSSQGRQPEWRQKGRNPKSEEPGIK